MREERRREIRRNSVREEDIKKKSTASIAMEVKKKEEH